MEVQNDIQDGLKRERERGGRERGREGGGVGKREGRGRERGREGGERRHVTSGEVSLTRYLRDVGVEFGKSVTELLDILTRRKTTVLNTIHKQTKTNKQQQTHNTSCKVIVCMCWSTCVRSWSALLIRLSRLDIL